MKKKICYRHSEEEKKKRQPPPPFLALSLKDSLAVRKRFVCGLPALCEQNSGLFPRCPNQNGTHPKEKCSKRLQ